MRMALTDVLIKVKPYMAMILLQVGYGGMYTISQASLKHGMNHYVLVVYRNSVAGIVMAPFALWFERRERPKLTFSTFMKIAALGLLEPVLDQNFYYMGAKATSAGFAAALFNILPAITFLMAIVLRMEKVAIKNRRSQAKVIGTLITVAGALLMILYKGSVVKFPWTKARASLHHTTSSGQSSSNWLMGIVMLLGSCFCWSGFFVLQSNTLDTYPAELSLTTLICFMGALESCMVALVLARGGKPWSIGFDMRLFTAVYSGVVCSGIAYYMQGKIMKERGPVFVTAFSPLSMIITALMGSILLSEEITVGSVIGAIIIVIGLYTLLWGKSNDRWSKTMETKDDKRVMQLPIVGTDAAKK